MQKNELNDKNLNAPKGDINSPEKDTSDNIKNVDTTTKNSEPFYLSDQSRNDSLENLTNFTSKKFPVKIESDKTIGKSDEKKIIESLKKTEPKQNVKNSNHKVIMQKDFSPTNKIENLKTERKILDPKVINEEIIKNYESEILGLKKKLQQLGLQSTPTEEVMQSKCFSLEGQLRKAQNEAELMTEQITGLRSQLQTWPNRIRELEEENEILRGRVEDVRIINQQRQNEIDELHGIVKNLETKLWENSSGSHHQEKIFLQRLMSEYDNLLKDYDLVKINNMTNERKMYEAKSRISDLTSKLSEFEINYRNLESENHFLKKKMSNEKTYSSSNYRNWERDVYPAKFSAFDENYHFKNGSSQELITSKASPNPEVETGMMSMSCYGALPSYGDSRNEEENVSTLRRFQYNKSRVGERYSHNEMSQSVYIQSKNDIATTPTNDRRRISIIENVQYGKNIVKENSTPFEVINKDSLDLMTQSMVRPINDFHGSGQPSRRRQKPDLYNRDSWAESKTEEEKELERRYDLLQNEKKQLLTNLSHVPTNSALRNRRTNREQRETLEAQLDHVDRQLGLLRMTLKQKNILK